VPQKRLDGEQDEQVLMPEYCPLKLSQHGFDLFIEITDGLFQAVHQLIHENLAIILVDPIHEMPKIFLQVILSAIRICKINISHASSSFCANANANLKGWSSQSKMDMDHQPGADHPGAYFFGLPFLKYLLSQSR
jgi:hypothetical protein